MLPRQDPLARLPWSANRLREAIRTLYASAERPRDARQLPSVFAQYQRACRPTQQRTSLDEPQRIWSIPDGLSERDCLESKLASASSIGDI